MPIRMTVAWLESAVARVQPTAARCIDAAGHPYLTQPVTSVLPLMTLTSQSLIPPLYSIHDPSL